MTPVALLREVDFLSVLDDDTLAEVAARAAVMHYPAGTRIVAELESGADVFIVTKGSAHVIVEPRRGATRILRTLEPGCAFGEMSSLTGALRSASVVAVEAIELLVIRDADFDHLRERRPEVALALLRTLAKRLAEVDRSIDALLTDPSTDSAISAEPRLEPGSIRRVWRELVVNRHRDLTFLTLVAFVLTLVIVRVVVYVSFRLELAPRGILRAAYMTGFTLLIVSAAAALLTFRPGVRRLVAIAFGIGVALIFNELGVTLAFDIYYKDIHTPDPTVAFDIEHLYRRTEAIRAIVIGLVVLVQAAYLRGFYRRAWFIIKTRVRTAFSR